MVPHGFWTEASIKQLSNNCIRSSELEEKNNYLYNQNAESINTTNVKQTEKKENKRVPFSGEPVCIITNDEEMNAVKLLDAYYEKINFKECDNACSILDEIQKRSYWIH